MNTKTKITMAILLTALLAGCHPSQNASPDVERPLVERKVVAVEKNPQGVVLIPDSMRTELADRIRLSPVFRDGCWDPRICTDVCFCWTVEVEPLGARPQLRHAPQVLHREDLSGKGPEARSSVLETVQAPVLREET